MIKFQLPHITTAYRQLRMMQTEEFALIKFNNGHDNYLLFKLSTSYLQTLLTKYMIS